MSVAIIINPIAGGRGRPASVGHRVDLARRVAAECARDADVFVTDRQGHARDLARAARASGAQLVVAWGGDGTVNEVASALAFGAVPMGIVADGSGNGLARELGIDSDPAGALRAALRAQARPMDLGEIGGRLFVNVAGVGFDAEIAARFNAPGNRVRGLTGYALLTAGALMRYTPRLYDITTPDSHATVRALFIVFANGTEFGNRIRIAPHARIDDGSLDLVVVAERTRAATMWNLRHVIARTVERASVWSARPVQQATIESDAPMRFHVDGEPVDGGTRLEARVHPAALQICVRDKRRTMPGKS